MSFIHQAAFTERGQGFPLATLGDTVGWGIRRYNKIFFRVSCLLISVHQTTTCNFQLLMSLFSLDSLLTLRLLD